MRQRNSRNSRRIAAILFSPIVFPIVTILATANCYGPTEVTVIVTTDLSCTEGPLTTSFFKGAPAKYDTASQAETTACQNEPSGSGGTVGTLVMVPSGDKDAEAAVKVIMAKPGKAAALCLTDPKDCIIARRAYNFGEHLSRRLPIRMLRECMGVACAEDQTCISGGRCVSAKTICEEETCLLPEERPPPDGTDGGPGSDGPPIGRDGDPNNPDSTLPDGQVIDPDAGRNPTVTDCQSSTGQLARATTIPSVRNAVASANALFYVRGERPNLVYTIAKTGGPETIAFTAAAGGQVNAITIDPMDNKLVVAYTEVTTRSVRQLSAAGPIVVPTNSTLTDVAVAPDNAAASRVYVSTDTEVFRLLGAGYTTPGGQGASRLMADATSVYYVPFGGGGLFRFTRLLTNSASVASAPTDAALAREASNNSVHAGGLRGGMGAVGAVGSTTFTPAFANIAETPQSLGADDQYYHFHNLTTFYRIHRLLMNPRNVVGSDASGGGFSHVFYDDAIGGCIYYWLKDAAGTGGTLKVRKKTTN
jgi:hypothetical protein